MSISLIKALQKLNLPAVEKATAIHFASHLWESDPAKGAWVGVELLAAESGKSIRSIERGLQGLRSKRILIKRGYHKGDKANMPIYTVHPENGTKHPRFQLREPANWSDLDSQEPATVAGSTDQEPAISWQEPAKSTEEPATVAVRTRHIGGGERSEKDIEKEKKKNNSLSDSETKSGRQGKADDRRTRPHFKEAKTLVRKIIAKSQDYEVLLGPKHQEALIDDLLDNPEILKWEKEVIDQAFASFLNSIPTGDNFERSQAAGRIATGLVASLIGDGPKANARNKYFENKAIEFVVYLSLERDTAKAKRYIIIKAQEDDAGEEYGQWLKDNDIGLDEDKAYPVFVPSNPAAYERWLLRDQMEGAYEQDKKKMQIHLDDLRAAVLISDSPQISKSPQNGASA